MKRLLVIDASVTAASPSMRGWLAASDHFAPEFDEIEIWAMHNELEGPTVRFVPMGGSSILGPLAPLYFMNQVNRRFSRLTKNYLAETLVQCTGCTVRRADIRFIHFWNLAFTAVARHKKNDLKIGLKERIFRAIANHTERNALKVGNTGEWWCVSRGIAEPILAADRNHALVRYLPNAYDPSRFNHATRAKWRNEMRAHYGIADDEVIFCFSGFGHFERKGLRQAAQAVNLLARKGLKAKLLVIGGKPTVIRDFKNVLGSSGIDLSNILFTGMVTEMEKHLSAGDALFFPSHFEAFSLAEIEAAALGLRLYLTAHPGQEMILREGVNGRLLPWDPQGMAAILEEEMISGTATTTHHEMGDALTSADYAPTLRSYFQQVIARKWETTS